MKSTILRIGALAERSGVSVKTIRYYSDRGLLPPTEVSAAGYRLYDEAARARLELIRTLRALDLPLAEIGRLLAGDLEGGDALRAQLDAIDVQLRDLTRRRLVLRHALEDESRALDRLDRLDDLARLRARDRSAFVAAQLAARTEGLEVDRDWLDPLIDAALGAVPDDLDGPRLEAWLALTELVADPTFLDSLRNVDPSSLLARAGRRDPAAWHRDTMALFDDVAEARARHTDLDPTSPRAERFAARYVAMFAKAMNRQDESALAEELLDDIDRHRDPRAERFWDLIGTIRGDDDPSRRNRAYAFLVEALRSRVRKADRA